MSGRLLVRSQVEGLELTDWGVSHTTLEDVFLKLAKHGSAESMETIKLNLSIFKEYNPGDQFVWGALDGLDYVIPAEKMPDEAAWQKKKQDDAQHDFIHHTVTMPKKMKNPSHLKVLKNTSVVQVDRSNPNDKLGLVLSNDSGPTEVVGVSDDGLCRRVVNVGDVIVAVNGVLADGHELTTQKLKVLTLLARGSRHEASSNHHERLPSPLAAECPSGCTCAPLTR